MLRAFVDTSAWFAYANRADRGNALVSRALDRIRIDQGGRLTTSNFVFDETLSLCRYRLGHKAAARVGSVLLDPQTVDLVRITAIDERDAWALFLERPDQRYSFTDCTSFVLMRRLGIELAAALDDDFKTEGFDVVP